MQNIYNGNIYFESEYLLSDEQSPIMKSIMLAKEIEEDNISFCETKNIDLIRFYKQIICLAAKLVKELGIPNNSISYSLIISELIHKGNLSNNNVFTITFNTELLYDLCGYAGIDVINGYGCCRHVSDIHDKIFNNLNMNGKRIACFGTIDNTSLDEAFRRKGNHMVNLLMFNGVFYVHDIFNKVFCEFKDGFTIQNGDFVYYYKPSGDMIFNGISRIESLKNIRAFHKTSKRPHISSREFNDILNETSYLYTRGTRSLIPDFMNETKEYTANIASLLVKK